MSSMFESVSAFNRALGAWNTGDVTDISRMFADYSPPETPS